MKKRYNVEIPYETREDIRRANNFHNWLASNDIQFETSAAGAMVHYEVFLSPKEVDNVNNALDTIVWFDSIVEA